MDCINLKTEIKLNTIGTGHQNGSVKSDTIIFPVIAVLLFHIYVWISFYNVDIIMVYTFITLYILKNIQNI